MKLTEGGVAKIEALEGAAKDMGMKILDRWLLEGSITQPAAQWFKDLGVLEVSKGETIKETINLSLNQMEAAIKQDLNKPIQLFDFFQKGEERADKRNFWILVNDIKMYGESKLGRQAVQVINIILPDSALQFAAMSNNYRSVDDGAYAATLDFQGKIVEKVGELTSGDIVFYRSTEDKGYVDYMTGEHAVINVR